jgi:hypothetical protein
MPQLAHGGELGEAKKPEGIAMLRLAFQRADHERASEALSASQSSIRMVRVPVASQPCNRPKQLLSDMSDTALSDLQSCQKMLPRVAKNWLKIAKKIANSVRAFRCEVDYRLSVKSAEGPQCNSSK